MKDNRAIVDQVCRILNGITSFTTCFVLTYHNNAPNVVHRIGFSSVCPNQYMVHE